MRSHASAGVPCRAPPSSVVKIVPRPLAGFDKNIYPCCSAIDYKFTQAVVRMNGISPIVSIAQCGPRIGAVHGRLRIDVSPAVAISISGMRSFRTFRTQCNCRSSLNRMASPNNMNRDEKYYDSAANFHDVGRIQNRELSDAVILNVSSAVRDGSAIIIPMFMVITVSASPENNIYKAVDHFISKVIE